MGELAILVNSVVTAERKELSKSILKVCTSITPQFYKNKTVEELQAEKLSIELLTDGIDQEVLGLMCRMAIKQYPLERARNNRTFFDINYILTFYEQAFNYHWCESVRLDRDCKYCDGEYNEYTKILVERWERNGEEIIIKYLVPQSSLDARCGSQARFYSPKFLQTYIGYKK